MIILAIESSCDDTCVAILKDKEILSNVKNIWMMSLLGFISLVIASAAHTLIHIPHPIHAFESKESFPL